MTTDPSSPIRELALTADAIAGRVRPWQIGHELAKHLTAQDRTMTTEEMAVVQALERHLDWSEDDGDREFRAWWLDEGTTLDEGQDGWPATWASVADNAGHPTIVAHLSDLLWTIRYGTAHEHARRAVDAYIASAAQIDEVHDRCRALVRAHELAAAVNDREQRSRFTCARSPTLPSQEMKSVSRLRYSPVFLRRVAQAS